MRMETPHQTRLIQREKPIEHTVGGVLFNSVMDKKPAPAQE